MERSKGEGPGGRWNEVATNINSHKQTSPLKTSSSAFNTASLWRRNLGILIVVAVVVVVVKVVVVFIVEAVTVVTGVVVLLNVLVQTVVIRKRSERKSCNFVCYGGNGFSYYRMLCRN